MAFAEPCLKRGMCPAGELVVRVGVPLLDDYLKFLAGRARPNTVLAAGYDVVVFFRFVTKEPHEVTSADVLAFITSQRSGGDGRSLRAVHDAAGVSARTVRRRLSTIAGLFSYLTVRGDVLANPVPRGLPTRREVSRPRAGSAAGAQPADAAASGARSPSRAGSSAASVPTSTPNDPPGPEPQRRC